MGLTDTENKVLAGIDHEGLKDFLGELIAARSDAGNETPAQILMKSKLTELGFKIDEWQLDFNKLSKHRDFSMSIPRIEGVGIVGTLGEDKGYSLILCGHIDTVSPGEESNWDSPPFKATIKDGNIYGRGSCDMKGGIACAVYAVKAILDSGLKLKGKLFFESTIGEEDGSPGALATCLRGYKADAGIIMEPTEVKIAPQVSGAMSFKVTIKGKSVHACVKDQGVSAIDKFIVINKGLLDLEKERNKSVTNPLYSRYETPFALNIGKIEGGQWPGTVAENLTFEARIGVAVNESLTQIKDQVEERIREISEKDLWLKDHQPIVEWNGYEFAPSEISVDHPIVVTLNDAYMDTLRETPVYEGITYASDARYLQNIANTPTVVFGPGDIRNAHGPNEYVPISDLEKTVKTLSLAIMRYVNVYE